MNCSNNMSSIGSLPCECAKGIPLLSHEKPDISGVDSLGNVYDSNHKIVGWWIEGPNKTIRAKMYESGIEYSLEMDRKLHKSKKSKKKKSFFSNVVSKIMGFIPEY